ncbi:hypothetical protein PCANC_27256 [Puccinia coronata f. sp. avenae]|uniref:DUF6818 domain-containing protein n=1 Tax=Puccinia coronata f. sp. avenae TaxID=200324 RepID=A0A2N5VN83_9BASI|nr:hypothetical protein PCANC_27256 [Puccinia coronata f. sp. avenae]PLW51448.1 hypothetical protein PCASD_00309 [Puccinia coronata f. sp. avenae]
MAPTQRNNSTQSPSATQQTGVGTQTAPSSTNTSQRRPGCAKGAQGYTSADCMALVEAVKHVLPLGANEWAIVHERYSKYALKNGQAICEQDSVKNKFRALVNLNKPTSDPDCPTWVREAKHNQKLIDNCAQLLTLDEESSGEDNGVGAEVSISLDDESNDESQWCDTQRVQEDNDSGLVLPRPLSFPPNTKSPNLSQVENSNLTKDQSESNLARASAVLLCFSPYARGSTGLHTAPHCHTPSQLTSKSPRGTLNCSEGRSASGGNLEQALMNHLDPATREKRDYENGMSRFYSMQLRDANKTIESLREKIN